MTDALSLRKKIKSKKPTFTRQDLHKKKSLKKGWRRPRGLQSKLRLQRRGKGKSVTQGYRSPTSTRGLHTTGLTEVVVSTVAELKGIDTKTQGITVASSVGNKKRVAIIEEAQKANIKILNIKKPEELVKQVKDKIEAKKKAKEALKKKKEKETKKKKDDKKLVDKISDEDKKEAEKKEKDKVLITKEQ